MGEPAAAQEDPMGSEIRTLALATDTALGAIYEKIWTARENLLRTTDSLHRAARDELTFGRGRRKAWRLSDAECVARVRSRIELLAPEHHNRRFYESILADLAAGPAAIAALEAEMAPLEALFRAHRWSRFFLVTSSDGHIHSSMGCPTCEPTTRYAWLPELSGLTEADAVAERGPRLCSVCFPSAPTEWTLGNPKAPRCPGSNTFVPNPGRRKYLICPACGTSQLATMSGLRAHKPRA